MIDKLTSYENERFSFMVNKKMNDKLFIGFQKTTRTNSNFHFLKSRLKLTT